MKVLLLLPHVALPREGHLEAAMHVMVHVDQRYNSRSVHDYSYTVIDHRVLENYDWSEFYNDTKETVHANTPEPQGKEVDITMFVNSDHTGDEVFCRSWSGCRYM